MQDLYRVKVLIRGQHTGLSVWQYVRPSGRDAKPYKFNRSEAEAHVRVMVTQSGMPENYQIESVDD